jgi:hypothetical protein
MQMHVNHQSAMGDSSSNIDPIRAFLTRHVVSLFRSIPIRDPFGQAAHCPRLHAINLTKLDRITDAGVRQLAHGCRNLTRQRVVLLRCTQIVEADVFFQDT